jgi:hypothetical protein
MLLADLADLGAEVIRVDRPGGNSPRCRRRAPASPAAASAASSTDRPTEASRRRYGKIQSTSNSAKARGRSGSLGLFARRNQ